MINIVRGYLTDGAPSKDKIAPMKRKADEVGTSPGVCSSQSLARISPGLFIRCIQAIVGSLSRRERSYDTTVTRVTALVVNVIAVTALWETPAYGMEAVVAEFLQKFKGKIVCTVVDNLKYMTRVNNKSQVQVRGSIPDFIPKMIVSKTTETKRVSANWKALSQEMSKTTKRRCSKEAHSRPKKKAKNDSLGSYVSDLWALAMAIDTAIVIVEQHSVAPNGKRMPSRTAPSTPATTNPSTSESSTVTKVVDFWFDDIPEEDLKSAYGSNVSLELVRSKGHVVARMTMDNDKDRENWSLEAPDPAHAEANKTTKKTKDLPSPIVYISRELVLSEELMPAMSSRHKVGKYIAMDCEMVGVGSGGIRSELARVSIINFYGHVILDTFVKPIDTVTDYRTHVSGVTPALLSQGRDFKKVQELVAALCKDRIVIGHAVHNDFKALLLDHPRKMTRDTQTYKPFQQAVDSTRPSLKRLADKILDISIQDGAHSSVQDARVAMLLYQMHRVDWERRVATRDRVSSCPIGRLGSGLRSRPTPD
ncbi:hypothetical protein SeLEV6574_g03434 [Synchytrium endobioticum]|uniref:RNA exonuclease 4 n=1 Tax=Synchytrium endobioticum TaxID=286115 RepID=A0A507D468_9FUNG|nr:hypothetical protein SeLEV6574_g03434 [Synchytrium endobioticum]